MRRAVVLLALSIVALPAFTFMPRTSAAPEPLLANQPLNEYKSRRQRLMEQVKDGVIVLGGAHESDFGEAGRFKQHNFFQYLSGVETPNAALVLVPKGIDGAREFLFIPARNPYNERWTGPQIGPGAEAETSFGFERVLPGAEFKKFIAKLAESEKNFYSITPPKNDTTRSREIIFADQLRELIGTAELHDASSALSRLRRTKSPVEVGLLQRAIDATGAAQANITRMLRPGLFEYEVEGEALNAFLKNGAERASFPSIVGSGLYSTVLHYERNRKQIDPGDLVVVDIGAEYSYYAADITRTYPASGKFTPRQREVYELVLKAQEECAKSVKPGQTRLHDLTQKANEVFAASPLRAKDDRGTEHPMPHFFIHGTSHFLGMDVHDVGDGGRALQPGDVITIEPGLYLPSERFGVRIEDDYLVTADGVQKLSAKIPSQPDEIERLVRKK